MVNTPPKIQWNKPRRKGESYTGSAPPTKLYFYIYPPSEHNEWMLEIILADDVGTRSVYFDGNIASENKAQNTASEFLHRLFNP